MAIKNWLSGTSLVVQWIRIYLLLQAARVQSLVQEDFTCPGAAKPEHNCWAPVPQLRPESAGERKDGREKGRKEELAFCVNEALR